MAQGWLQRQINKANPSFFNSTNRKTTEASTSAQKKANIVKRIVYSFSNKQSNPRNLTYESPKGFTFTEIDNAYFTDTYIRQAVDKKVDFMFKAGWDIVGKNVASVDYVKTRIDAISVAGGRPFNDFLIEVADNLVKYHNVFIIKARAPNGYQYPKGITVKPTVAKTPVACYFIAPVTTMTIARDEYGAILKYKQTQGSNTIEFAPTEVIHITVDKPAGYPYGMPQLAQVLDDVKMLRLLEELVNKMIYKNINPQLVYTVGTTDPGMQSTDEEITEVQTAIENLGFDEGLVIPERHKLDYKHPNPMSVSEYLEFFKKRVFTGLGVSSTIMGEGDTVNKSTSDNLDQMFKDDAKARQKIMSDAINFFMIREILLEGGYDVVTNPEDCVFFLFREIDAAAKNAHENHMVQMFTQNAITHDEMRNEIGKDPLTPEQENRLYFKMITAAGSDTEAANNAGANKDQPANQYGKRSSPKTKQSISERLEHSNSGINDYSYKKLEEDVVGYAQAHQKSLDGLKLVVGAYYNTLVKSCLREAYKQLQSGATQCISDGDISHRYLSNISAQESSIKINLEKPIDRLINKDLFESLKKVFTSYDGSELITKIHAIFNSFKYRIDLINHTESMRAYNLGYLCVAQSASLTNVVIKSEEDSCEKCLSMNGVEIDVASGNAPPFHPGCYCMLTLKKGVSDE